MGILCDMWETQIKPWIDSSPPNYEEHKDLGYVCTSCNEGASHTVFVCANLIVVLSLPSSCLGDVINLGDRQLTVLHMPGHSRGSICLHDRDNKMLFSGDVVYDGAMIDWLPYSHVTDYIGSCERLVGLVDSEQVTIEHTRMRPYHLNSLTDPHSLVRLTEL